MRNQERDLFAWNRFSEPLLIFETAWGLIFLLIMTWTWWPSWQELVDHGFTHWKLEGPTLVRICWDISSCSGQWIWLKRWIYNQAFLLDELLHKLHPKNRFPDTGFYDYDPHGEIDRFCCLYSSGHHQKPFTTRNKWEKAQITCAFLSSHL